MHDIQIQIIGRRTTAKLRLINFLSTALSRAGVRSDVLGFDSSELPDADDDRVAYAFRDGLCIADVPAPGVGVSPDSARLEAELVVARQSAQKMHTKCQAVEAELAQLRASLDRPRGSDSYHYNRGYESGRRSVADRVKASEEIFEKRLARYKFATRRALRQLSQIVVTQQELLDVLSQSAGATFVTTKQDGDENSGSAD